MKKFFFFIAFLSAICVHAQSRMSDDIGRITIHAYVPKTESLPYESQKLLQSKLSQIITSNGIADNENCARFILAAKINVLSKDIVPGPPEHITQKIEVSLVLGDIMEDKVYSAFSLPVIIGVGQSVEKAYISAINRINPLDPAIKSFILEGKREVVSYYQIHGAEILSEAQKQAKMQHFEDALILLSSIPDVCSDSFEEASRMAIHFYKEMIDSRGLELLNLAKSRWASNPTKDGAKEATFYLSQINYAASCQPQVSSLLNSITSKMNEIDARDWEHQLQVSQDGLEKEKRDWEQSVREYDDCIQTQRMIIKACRDVALTYAKNQPHVVNRTINYNRVLLW